MIQEFLAANVTTTASHQAAPNATAALLGTIIQFAPYIILLGVGLGAGFFMARSQTVAIGRVISHAIKHGNPLLFLSGYDGNMRAVEFNAGATGLFHDDKLGIDMTPDARGMYKFYGTSLGWATSRTISNFNSKFEEDVDAWRKAQAEGKLTKLEAAIGRKIGTSTQDLARALYDLQNKRKVAREALDEFERWDSKQITLTELISSKGLTESEGKKYSAEMEKLAPTAASYLKEQIQKLDEAAKIENIEDWDGKLDFNKDGTAKFSYKRTVLHTLDDLFNFIPTSADLLIVRNMIERAVQIRAKESTEMNKALTKYLGPVMLILSICIGAAVIFSVLK